MRYKYIYLTAHLQMLELWVSKHRRVIRKLKTKNTIRVSIAEEEEEEEVEEEKEVDLCVYQK